MKYLQRTAVASSNFDAVLLEMADCGVGKGLVQIRKAVAITDRSVGYRSRCALL